MLCQKQSISEERRRASASIRLQRENITRIMEEVRNDASKASRIISLAMSGKVPLQDLAAGKAVSARKNKPKKKKGMVPNYLTFHDPLLTLSLSLSLSSCLYFSLSHSPTLSLSVSVSIFQLLRLPELDLFPRLLAWNPIRNDRSQRVDKLNIYSMSLMMTVNLLMMVSKLKSEIVSYTLHYYQFKAIYY